MFGLNEKEMNIFRALNTPRKIQDFLDKIPINFEEDGKDTFFSPRLVLRNWKAHCFEGAVFAAAALKINGEKPLILDLKTTKDDFYHVICVFKKNGYWGAIGKTNHAVLRYREPVYKNVRELAMSFFHEYFDDTGKKNLRSYSDPIDLSRFDKFNWMASEDHLWFIEDHLEKTNHFSIVDRKQIATLRRADEVEIAAGKIVEWKAGKK